MAVQIQLHKSGTWIGIAVIPNPSQALLRIVRSSKDPVRLFDMALDRVMACSQKAFRIKDPVRGRGITPHRTFSPAREPDPYNVPESRVLRTRREGRYKPFSGN